jgi:hypothetical protein
MRQLLRRPKRKSLKRSALLVPIVLGVAALLAVACSNGSGADAFAFGDDGAQSLSTSGRVGAPSLAFEQTDDSKFSFD